MQQEDRSMDRSRGSGIETFCSRVAWQLRHLSGGCSANRRVESRAPSLAETTANCTATCFRQEGRLVQDQVSSQPTDDLATLFR